MALAPGRGVRSDLRRDSLPLAARGAAPKAILFNSVNPALAQGGARADRALCDRFEEEDVTKLIKTGDQVTVDPENGLVTVVTSD